MDRQKIQLPLGIGLLTTTLFLVSSFKVIAQEDVSQKDTLLPSQVTAQKGLVIGLGEVKADASHIADIVSPLGMGDPLRWVQTLPGVASGADGTSAFFVRGGNMGGNLITLDGIPVYGSSHLLGLTQIISPDLISDGTLKNGGFGGDQGNFTSSHLSIVTKEPDNGSFHATLSLNSFLPGLVFSTPLGSKISAIAGARVSPFTYEYNAMKGLLGGGLGDLNSFRADVYDLYGKVSGRFGMSGRWSLSGLGSKDQYSFNTSDDSSELLGWSNIGAIGSLKVGGFSANASFYSYKNNQEQNKTYHNTNYPLSVQSSFRETILSAGYRLPVGTNLDLSAGIKARIATFSPRASGKADVDQHTSLISANLQANWRFWKIEGDGTVRLNRFKNESASWWTPDINLSLRYHITPYLTLEGTFDRMSQYYHTLEGLPVGWSVDLFLPSSAILPDEHILQGYGGLQLSLDHHHATIGAYYKKMDNLIYYKDALTLFNGVNSNWSSGIEKGEGDSYGIEAMYEFLATDWYGRVSATVSKSTRWGFIGVYEGASFHAPFDRRLVLNMMIKWKDWSLSFVYQDGNWVNGRAEHYQVTFPGYAPVLDYYASVNNHQMPAVIRVDAGYQHVWQGKKHNHTLRIGVCNLLNHFNPFTVYYDTNDGKWKELALLPILPNFSYVVSF